VQNSWRERIKSGPLQGSYTWARRLKRRVRGEPLVGLVPSVFVPLPLATLRAAVVTMLDEPRIYYSMALAYLDVGAARPALACLRCAEALDFEGIERINLYKAVIAARRGRLEEARLLASALSPDELSEHEIEIRSSLMTHATVVHPIDARATSAWRAALERAPADVRSVLVCSDGSAESADMLPAARYLLADPTVTGLDPASVARLDRAFDVVLGTPADITTAQAAGVRSDRWIILEDGLSHASLVADEA
jgi:hypothetical protein